MHDHSGYIKTSWCPPALMNVNSLWRLVYRTCLLLRGLQVCNWSFLLQTNICLFKSSAFQFISSTLRQMILSHACYHWPCGALALVNQTFGPILPGVIALCKLNPSQICPFEFLLNCTFGLRCIYQLFAGLVPSHRVSQLATILSIPPSVQLKRALCSSVQLKRELTKQHTH